MQNKQVSNEPSTYVAILPHLRLSIARSSCKGSITLPMLTTDLILRIRFDTFHHLQILQRYGAVCWQNLKRQMVQRRQ